MTDYADFLNQKAQYDQDSGFAPLWMPDFLFDFQKALTEWAIRKGRGAIFADCVGGESIINSPEGDIPIAEAHRKGKPVWVFALREDVPCIEKASSPFIAGVQALYRFSFASGRCVVATLGHHFLSVSGWKRGGALKIGEHLLVSDASHLRSTLGLDQLTHGANGQSFDGKGKDSSLSYSACSDRRGGQPPVGEDIDPSVFPLQADARGHSQQRWHRDGLDNELTRSHHHLTGDRPSIGHCETQVVTTEADAEYQPLSFDPSCNRGNIRTFQQALEGSNPPTPICALLPSAESQSADGPSVALNPLLDIDTLVAVDYIRFDAYYDIEVPGSKCLLIDGVWSHNCGLGKTVQQLVWAENIVRRENKPVLILTPLAVSYQTVAEAGKFGIEAHRSISGEVHAGINVTNYERLSHFNSSDFAGVVADESSILKSYDGARRRQITEFMRKLPYRLLCTATAAPNDYIELGTSSEALGYLGYTDMLTRFFKNDQNTIKPMRYSGFGNPRASHPQGREHTDKWRFKGHAEIPFWRWVCSWARAVRRPSDLGFADESFVLPPLVERQHLIDTSKPAPDMLFVLPAVGLREQREERRRTLRERCEFVATLVNNTKAPALVWCHLNPEGDLLERLISDAVQVSGADSDDAKEEALMGFARGGIRVLVTKPRIGAWGLNLQRCSHVTFFPSHSYEQYYQGVRRCWRFGQKHPVTVDIITTEGEQQVLENLQRKARAADKMFSDLVTYMGEELRVARSDYQTRTVEVPVWMRASKAEGKSQIPTPSTRAMLSK